MMSPLLQVPRGSSRGVRLLVLGLVATLAMLPVRHVDAAPVASKGAAVAARATPAEVSEVPKSAVYSAESYRTFLEERRHTRADRRRVHAEELYAAFRNYLSAPGLQAELKLHAERRARLRRIGNLVLVVPSSQGMKDRIVLLMGAEAERHRVAMQGIVQAAPPGRGGS